MEPLTDMEELRRALAEAQRQHQQERRRAEEERQRAEEERQRAEEERQRANEARQQLELERQRTNEAEQQQQQERQRAESAEQRTRPTTLHEVLEGYHAHITSPLTIQTDQSLSTSGNVTKPNKKYYPGQLREWKDFPEIQASAFSKVYEIFHPASQLPVRLFKPIIYLEELGPDICDRPLASELDLQQYQRYAVEQPVTSIISALRERFEDGEFNIGNGILFENHANTLSDINEEVQQRQQQGPQRRYALNQSADNSMRPKNTDQICVYKNADNRRIALFIIEYKPPHKLSVGDLLWGLREDMSIQEVIERDTIPQDPDKKLKQNSDEVVAAVVTQTFHYMIQCGVEFSYITTGEAFVFLRVKEEDPTTLFYHIAVPREGVDRQNNPKLRVFYTAIGQVLSFCLMALGSTQRTKEWQHNAYRRLKQWPEHREFCRTPQSERVQTPPASEFKSRLRLLTPRSFGLRQRHGGRVRCADGELDFDNSESSEDDSHDTQTPSKPGGKQSSHTTSTTTVPSGSPASSQMRTGSQKYCTQACLLGLKRGDAFDATCPNVSLHCAAGNGTRHTLTVENFAALVINQLATNLDQDCEPLGKQGARGALFKITLTAYGYTFVAKGTVSVFRPDLLHEGRVYRVLDAVQGELVPVYLGNIDLVRKYDLDLGVRIEHMLLMSWCGLVAKETNIPGLRAEVRQLVNDIGRRGVIHNDERVPNILWNAELERLMLIDFDRSVIVTHEKLGASSPRRNTLPKRSGNRMVAVEGHEGHGHTQCRVGG